MILFRRLMREWGRARSLPEPQSLSSERKMSLCEYEFPSSPAEQSYRIFPPEIENDPAIYFHGTNAENLPSIRRSGFRMPPPDNPPSVSYSSNSSFCLGIACEKRTVAAPKGCVIAVRYPDLDRPSLVRFGTIMHDYTLDSQPEIVGWCIVPEAYQHR